MTSLQSVNRLSRHDVVCESTDLTTGDSDPSHYLQDPELFIDKLPQPFRRINRVLNSIIEDVLEIAVASEAKLIHDDSRRQAPMYDSAIILEELFDLVSITASPDGKFVYMSDTEGRLCCLEALHRHVIADWRPDVAAADQQLTSLSAYVFSDNVYLITAVVNKSDAVKLFMHIESVLVLAQALSLDIEDPLASHRKSSVVSVEVSGCVDYVGLVAQSSLDSAPTPQESLSPSPVDGMWLEVYRLPKDSWLKELEPIQQMLKQSAIQDDDEEEKLSFSSVAVPAVKFTPLSIVLRLRPPAKPTGMVWSSPHQALKLVEAGMQEHVIGTGLNHLVSKQHLELRQAAFEHYHRQHAVLLHSASVDALMPQPAPARPTFHLLTPCKQMPQQQASETTTAPTTAQGASASSTSTTIVAIWWTGSSHVLHYSLLRPLKDPDAGMAELVWPMSAPIVATAASSCCTLLAVAVTNNDVVIWNRESGLCMRTAKVRGCGSLCSLQFINSLPASATTAAAIPASACINSTQPPHPHLSLVMRAVSGHVFTLDCSRQRCTVPARSVYLDVQYDDEIPDTIQPVHTMPQLLVLCCRDGRLFISDIEHCQLVCELVKPSVSLATQGQPLQPLAFTMADAGRSVFAIVRLPTEETDSEANMKEEQRRDEKQEEDVDDEGDKEVLECCGGRTFLLVYRLMYMPAFDHYSFHPAQTTEVSSMPGVSAAMSQPKIGDQVNTALQARLAERAERRNRLEKRWAELKTFHTKLNCSD